MDRLTPEQRLRCMRANKSEDTKPERALGRLMWRCGLRYRKHPRRVYGRPDFCIRKYRLAIFVDGEFWHGRNWPEGRDRLKSNREFWIRKIERNIERDRRVNFVLRAQGWEVMRFWESDILTNPGAVISQILGYLNSFGSFAAEPSAAYGKQ